MELGTRIGHVFTTPHLDGIDLPWLGSSSRSRPPPDGNGWVCVCVCVCVIGG